MFDKDRGEKRPPFVTDHFPSVLNLCGRKREKDKRLHVCAFSVWVFFFLEHFGALCKVRCLSVYGLTIVELWVETEGNPMPFDPQIHNPSTAE